MEAGVPLALALLGGPERGLELFCCGRKCAWAYVKWPAPVGLPLLSEHLLK